MARLPRPHIPIATKCIVALHGLGEAWPEDMLAVHSDRAALLAWLLRRLKELHACDALHLDHDPALALREKVFKSGVHVDYIPAAADSAFLIYRPVNGHKRKTHGVRREDCPQFSDRILIKRERRRGRKRVKRPWPKRPFPRREA